MSESREFDYGRIDFSSENEHGVLAESEQQELKRILKNKYGSDIVGDFYDRHEWMYNWKAHRRSDDGIKLAVAYARALGLREEVIKSYEDIDPSEVTEDHVALARDLHNAGKEWFRHKFGDSVHVYRGFKNGGLKMLSQLYEDNSDILELSGNEIENWSWKIEPALEWGRKRTERDSRGALVRAERDIEDFVFTIDGIAGDYVNHHDSAITFEGGVQIPKDQVSIELVSNAVRDYEAEDEDGFDREWVFYEGSFFPYRSMQEQDIDALKSAAIEFGEETSIGIFLEDERGERFVERLSDLRSHLEDELNPEDPKDDQILEAAEKAENRTRKHIDW